VGAGGAVETGSEVGAGTGAAGAGWHATTSVIIERRKNRVKKEALRFVFMAVFIISAINSALLKEKFPIHALAD
jgi:hypothetical protein